MKLKKRETHISLLKANGGRLGVEWVKCRDTNKKLINLHNRIFPTSSQNGHQIMFREVCNLE